MYYNNIKAEANTYIDQIDSFIRENGGAAANKHRPTLAALGNLRKLKKHLESLDEWDIPKPKKFDFWVRASSEITIPVKKKKNK